jgi:outer membrane protein OmpA-like peptidoglycan-associated protein
MIRCSRILDRAIVLAVVAVAGCATQSGTVVLLPEREGRDASVLVTQGEKSLVLDRAYAASDFTSNGPKARQMSAEDVEARFGSALAAQPMRAAAFTLYFTGDTDALTEESQRMIDGVLAEIARHPVPDIVVVGHTDLVGSEAFNDALARRRADSVRLMLIARGVAPESIVAVGRGKREPAVATADGVAEPRNRRVELVVR